MFRIACSLLLFFVLTACGRGPQVGQIQEDLAKGLSNAFGGGTFEIVSLVGRGSSTDVTSAHGENRRVVYYDVELRLTRDLNFGAWNTPGVASLVTVLGAGPKGIKGIKTSGNRAGDKIFGHGTRIYHADREGWQPVVAAGFTAPAAPALDRLSPPRESDRLLETLQSMIGSSPVGSTPTVQALIDHELSRTVATIQAHLTRLSRGYPIAAGAEDGHYFRLVRALQAAKPFGLNFQALTTEGSVENVTLLRQNRVSFALTQSDVAQQAVNGVGAFSSHGPFAELRVVGSLYPEPMHIIVRADSPAQSVRDLSHRRIALGSAGSGTRATAERVLDAHGMRAGRDYTIDESQLAAALDALGSGALDAVIQMIGIPSDQVRTTGATVPLRLLPLEEGILTDLTSTDPSLLRSVIPKATYPGVGTDISTLAVTALLVTTSALSDPEIRALTFAIFGNGADLLAAGSAQASQMGVNTARMGSAIPLHGAAELALSELAAGKGL